MQCGVILHCSLCILPKFCKPYAHVLCEMGLGGELSEASAGGGRRTGASSFLMRPSFPPCKIAIALHKLNYNEHAVCTQGSFLYTDTACA